MNLGFPKQFFPGKMKKKKKDFVQFTRLNHPLTSIRILASSPCFWKLSHFPLSDLPPDVFGYQNFPGYSSQSLSLFLIPQVNFHIHFLLLWLFALMSFILVVRTKPLDSPIPRGLLLFRKVKARGTVSKMYGKVCGESRWVQNARI